MAERTEQERRAIVTNGADAAQTGGVVRKTAVALGYEPEDTAPKIIASGQGVLAEKIIEKAKEADIPLHRDDRLANTLSKLDIGDYIPPELYEVVAEILLFVDRLDRIKEKMHGKD